MAELDIILADVARSIVDEPDAVKVARTDDGDNVILTLSVAADDMGRVIGRHGKIARAIRLLMKVAAGKQNKKVTVDIK